MQDKNNPNSQYPNQDDSPEITTSKKRKRGEQEQDDSQGQQQAQPQDQRLAASSSSSNQDKIDNPPAKRQKTNSSDEEGIDINDADTDYEDQMEADLPRAGLNTKSKEIERIDLKEFYISEIRYPGPTKENFKKFVDLAARYINGEVTILSAGAKSHHRAIFVAAILENKSLKSAQTYLKIIKRDSEIVKELATDFILRFGTTGGLDCALKLGVDLRKINPQNLQGQNILEVASKNPDQLAMLKHVMKIIILHGHNSNSFLSIVNSAMQVGSFDIVKMLIEFIPQDQMENYSRGFHEMSIVNYAAQCKDNGAMLRHVVDLIGRDLAKKLALPSCIGNSDSCSYSGIFSAYIVGNIQGLKFLLELFSPDELFAWRNQNNSENILMHALHYSNNLELLKILADKLGGEKAAKLVDVQDRSGETLRRKVIMRGDEKSFDFLSSLTPDWTNDPKLVYEILRYAELINQKIYKYIVENYYSVKGDELESVGKVYEAIKRNNSGQQSVQNPMRNISPQPRLVNAPNNPPMGGNMPPQSRPVSGPNQQPMGGNMPPQHLRSSSPTVAPLASSSNVVAAAQQAPLAQTGMSSLELFEALKRRLLDGPETAVSAMIKANLQVLEGLIIGHQAVVDSQNPNDSHSRNI